MIPAALLPYKWALVAAAFAATAAVSGAAGWTAQGWRKDAVIADLKAAESKQESADSRGALDQVKRAASAVSAAASEAGAESAAAAKTFKALAKEMKNAKPLPADCRPDDQRLRNRNDAIRAYNAARSGSEPGHGLSGN